MLTLAKAYRSGAWPLAPVQNESPSQALLPGRGTGASSVAIAVSKLSLRRAHDGAPELTVRYISHVALGAVRPSPDLLHARDRARGDLAGVLSLACDIHDNHGAVLGGFRTTRM